MSTGSRVFSAGVRRTLDRRADPAPDTPVWVECSRRRKHPQLSSSLASKSLHVRWHLDMFSFVDLRLLVLLSSAALLISAQGEDDRKSHQCFLELLRPSLFDRGTLFWAGRRWDLLEKGKTLGARAALPPDGQTDVRFCFTAQGNTWTPRHPHPCRNAPEQVAACFQLFLPGKAFLLETSYKESMMPNFFHASKSRVVK